MIEIRFLKVKPEKVEKLREWMSELTCREDEALATLQQETVRRECAFLLETTRGPVLAYVIEADDMEIAKTAVRENPHLIDLEHRAVMSDVVEGPADVETLLDLRRN